MEKIPDKIASLNLMATYANDLRTLAIESGIFGLTSPVRIEDNDYEFLINRAAMEKALGRILSLADDIGLSHEMINIWKELYHDEPIVRSLCGEGNQSVVSSSGKISAS